jgi:electron transport complex protein RnfE
MSLKRAVHEFTKGLIAENPVLGLMLGLCSALAVSTEVMNALGMGAAMTFVLLGSNTLISLLRNSIPAKIRLPVFIVVIASFTTIVDLLMNAFTPDIHRSLGIFIPLIVVNCIIIARAEAFAVKNTVGLSIIDAIGMGVGYTLVLTVIATIREILGSGTFLGTPLFDIPYIGFLLSHLKLFLTSLNLWGIRFFEHFDSNVLVMLLPPGAFITIGLLMAGMRGLRRE